MKNWAPVSGLAPGAVGRSSGLDGSRWAGYGSAHCCASLAAWATGWLAAAVEVRVSVRAAITASAASRSPVVRRRIARADSCGGGRTALWIGATRLAHD